MARKISPDVLASFPPVDRAPVAWSDDFDFIGDTPKEARENAPFKAGDVIFFERGGKAVKAVVAYVFREPTRLGDWRSVFKVAPLTASGEWSRAWVKAWPGFIERGYEIAKSKGEA